jgi:nucleoside-triphosphatase THEP1
MLSENKNIFILSAPIKTGKTTSILRWSEKQKSVLGIVQPVINNRRHLIDLSNKETKPLETEKAGGNTLEVGGFKFLKSSFEWAKIVLLYSAKQKPGWLVIDEFGKLELNGQGLEPVITYLLNDSELLAITRLIIVIRDYLVEEAVLKMGLTKERFILLHRIDGIEALEI